MDKEKKNTVLVIGGGIAGISASLHLANDGWKVYLIEKSSTLGGKAASFCCKATDVCVKCSVCLVVEKVKEVTNHSLISLFLNSQVADVQGKSGNFKVKVVKSNQEIKFETSAIIVASGFDVFDPRKRPEFGYGRYSGVISGFDVEEAIFKNRELFLNGKKIESLAFVQCVGSRDRFMNRDYCSRVCCKYALKIANLLKYKKNELDITIFYMDMQTAGKDFGELYDNCKDKFNFIRAIPGEITENDEGKLKVAFENKGKVDYKNFDVVILSVGMNSSIDAENLSDILKINRQDNGFFESLNDIDTVLTNCEGIYLAGSCQGPKNINSSVAHGLQAALKVIERCKV